MTRGEAYNLVVQSTKNRNLVKHMLAVEAGMRALAERLGEEPDIWGLAGLLHDLDYEETKNNFPRHGFVTREKLLPLGVDEKILDAIVSHPGHPEHFPRTPMEIALYSVDPLTGLIVASALMHPTKSLEGVTTEFILKRFKEKRFAAGANREQIRYCEKLGLSLKEFIEIVLNGMKEVSDELEL
ncbi:MAG: phosphohydrolase [candidate division Zixibacteria bacterium 4484_93]|nr:MAG: phosphohydrolase [candidate division Zixibacteria bacterium 4484_93]RKZ34216.1 MAG: phosphohydrolase [bacterium]